MPDLVEGLNDPARGDFNNKVQEVSGKQAGKTIDKVVQKESTKGAAGVAQNNTQSPGYDSRKTHSAKNESSSSTSSKQ